MQVCPICQSPVEPSKRYPRYVCESCAERASAKDGRALQFEIQDGLDGMAAFYADDATRYTELKCYIDGIACRYKDARFGGLVIEVVQLAKPDMKDTSYKLNRKTEKQLDQALAKALTENVTFVEWLLSRTKFAMEGKATCVWVRADHPWGRANLRLLNKITGELETVSKEGETDVLAVFQSEGGKRFALHFENKMTNGRFRLYQAELYEARAKKWAFNARYGNYSDWQVVLVAPTEFRNRFRNMADQFSVFIPHEEIAIHIGEFSFAPGVHGNE